MKIEALPVKMDIKRSFRLRPVDTTGRLNRRYGYLRSPCIRSIAVLQLLMGFIVIIAQIMILCISRRGYEDNLLGSGIGMGMIQILASVFTLMAAEDPVYSWLHLGMSFNVISAVGYYILAGYIMWYPIADFIELQKLYETDPVKVNPYNTGEIDFLTTCMYTIVVSSIASFVVGIFLAICTGRPVCCGCGQKYIMSGGTTERRKLSGDGPKSPRGINSSGNVSPTKLEFRRTRNPNIFSEKNCS